MSTSPWIFALGFFAQGLFAARMLVQWLLSEKAGKVINPTVFWVLSLIASLLFFIYGWLRQDFALMLGQVIGYCAYVWNLDAKGVWRPLGAWRPVATSLLLAVPAAAIGIVAAHWPEVREILFHNDAIPRWLLILGVVGQTIFSLRFLYQLFYSASRRESLLPTGFWIISLTGAILILTYGILRRDPVLILAQSFGLVTYIRNLMLIRRNRAA
ncbi:MAG: lipid-A-disaccharide synthase N-terminal domain-containing protein [Bacteroidales bacterium]|nr:lipid-A-disaccharide synthase N-terminal domain-containing protein [Bacteroidales bacterium]MBQ1753456.1 lipid-A-disaccharide synthase N-terminal domain-containing protein [Bacteroidales bacterium]MBQ1831736.1 lipid-A-disaccharide synthase N-terminal domain-containing protein [Bacteroidales bacterium]MBQ4221831.1 lipid-A-disaccharide synthase N-terminal domain-containing protein [Bacteroidales bacterium]MBQ5438589.1 lipid-A-disaccharide synthase N-terminal domain-containing protein [Bacteroi